jgi:hypothetical protein
LSDGRESLNLLIETIGFLFNILGIILLYFSSIPKPWDIQSWSGTTPKEKAYEDKRNLQRIFGAIFLIFGIVCMFSYTNKLIIGLIQNIIVCLREGK